jgi:hypothetical protein
LVVNDLNLLLNFTTINYIQTGSLVANLPKGGITIPTTMTLQLYGARLSSSLGASITISGSVECLSVVGGDFTSYSKLEGNIKIGTGGVLLVASKATLRSTAATIIQPVSSSNIGTIVINGDIRAHTVPANLTILGLPVSVNGGKIATVSATRDTSVIFGSWSDGSTSIPSIVTLSGGAIFFGLAGISSTSYVVIGSSVPSSISSMTVLPQHNVTLRYGVVEVNEYGVFNLPVNSKLYIDGGTEFNGNGIYNLDGNVYMTINSAANSWHANGIILRGTLSLNAAILFISRNVTITNGANVTISDNTRFIYASYGTVSITGSKACRFISGEYQAVSPAYFYVSSEATLIFGSLSGSTTQPLASGPYTIDGTLTMDQGVNIQHSYDGLELTLGATGRFIIPAGSSVVGSKFIDASSTSVISMTADATNGITAMVFRLNCSLGGSLTVDMNGYVPAINTSVLILSCGTTFTDYPLTSRFDQMTVSNGISNNGSTNYAASSHAVTGSSTFAASTPTHASSGGTTSGIGISMSNNSGSNVGGSGTGSTRGSSRSPKPAVVRLPGVPDQHAPNSPYS